MALSASVEIILEFVINLVLYYIASAIICSIMFRRQASKWSWLNLIMGAIASAIWIWGVGLGWLGTAEQIIYGILFFLICWVLWVLLGGISERRAVYATVGSLLLWFLFCWILMVLFSLFNVQQLDNFPTLLGWLPGPIS